MSNVESERKIKMNALEIKGKVNTALCYAKVVEDEAIEQIRRMCDYAMTEGSQIRIMPDVHAGKGCTIGTTMTITDKAVPNVVGVDIGCGMYTVNLGKQVAELYQKLAINLNRGYGEYLEKRDEIIRTYKEQGRKREIQDALKQLHWQVYESPTSMPEDLCYLEGIYLEDYLHDVEICQAFARRSREKMAEVILERTVMTGSDAFHTIHNYIDIDEMILRKGAIAAHKGEKVLIPINMKDGSILAIGKGNPEWNYSAPHGAGRIMSRTKAKNELNLDEYKKAMEGVYTTSVNENTLDEAPMAYKSLDDIIDVIRESVDVIDVMKPIYNFKASE